ncbi:complexin-4 [Patagioenas fasciata monilis]|uniref:Complexin-4 n=1 Tax=Patagioenas fasciata monilis TaxID=372326 RepID=A0A1V4JGP5_PATFA|nr:complexin-4 [Patagioenas fasciata monilis]
MTASWNFPNCPVTHWIKGNLPTAQLKSCPACSRSESNRFGLEIVFMAFLMKSMLSNQVKNLGLGGGGEESKEESAPSDPAAAAGMTREEYEEYQKQMVEEKMERDAAFAQKKAERACLRVHLREKYRLPKSELDENQIQMAGDDVGLPEDLQKMVAEDQVEEEDKDSILGQLQNIQNMDMDAIKEKAQATFTEMKQAAEQKCAVM